MNRDDDTDDLEMNEDTEASTAYAALILLAFAVFVLQIVLVIVQ